MGVESVRANEHSMVSKDVRGGISEFRTHHGVPPMPIGCEW